MFQCILCSQHKCMYDADKQMYSQKKHRARISIAVCLMWQWQIAYFLGGPCIDQVLLPERSLCQRKGGANTSER